MKGEREIVRRREGGATTTRDWSPYDRVRVVNADP
jgi:hypothetical protein